MRSVITSIALSLIHVNLAAQLAELYPYDINIENDPNVMYVEKFDDGLPQIVGRYTDILNPGSLLIDNDVPPGSTGGQSIRITSAPGVSTGAHLFRNFQSGFDQTVHVRYYVKYPASSEGYFHHEGIWFGGYNPATPWPKPGAGTCGLGDQRLSVAFEPVWHDTDPPGFDTYLYWGDMKSWNDGSSCFGNVMVTQGATEYNEPLDVGDYPAVELDEWMCIEMMIKLNDPVTAYNGELAIWVNGEQIGHWGPGFPNGHWLKDKWYNNSAAPPFEGFRWRTHPDLNINWIWIQYFHSNPIAPPSFVKYDHLVVANTYIGPIHIPTGTNTHMQEQESMRLYPNPVSASTPVTITLDDKTKVDGNKWIGIYDLIGRNIYTSEQLFVSGSTILTIPSIETGMYILQVRDAAQTVASKLVLH